MKKRMILVLALIGVLAFGAGLGTYAWFTAQVKSENNLFETGTFEIDGQYGQQTKDGTIFNATGMKPGDGATTFTEFEITNTGSLDMDVRAIVTIDKSYVNGKNADADVDTLDLKEFTVIATVNIGGEEYDFEDTLPEFKTWIEDLKGTLSNNQTLTVNGSISLNNIAGNEYQGLRTQVDLTIYAKQTNAEWHDTYPEVFEAEL